MKAFDKVRGIAAPLRLANIDTDKIVPGRFLKTISRAGLGSALFADMRAEEGFILNRSPWKAAQILVALENFGCGSSREHAPWALAEYGLRCIIAPSFADIFHTNCFRNGLLPVILPKQQVEILLDVVSCAGTSEIEVDLLEQTVRTFSSSLYHFEIDSARKKDLLEGRDEIDGVMALQEDIASFERRRERVVYVPRDASF